MRMQPTSSLPLDLWKQVLAHTSQADRARCSLVSRAFQAAAVAALETVEVSFRDQASVDSLQAWLHNHGQYVKDLQVSSWLEHATLALLACQHLQELDLAQIEVVLPMGPNSPSSHGRDHPWGLTALTNLHLLNCTVAGGLVGLSVLTALKELKVINTVGRSQPCFPGSVFQHYRLLTRLELAAVSFTELHFVSCLVNLQQLIGYTNSIPNITRGLLPGGLPASLRVLELWPIVLDPVVLLGLTNLQELRLVGSSNDFELAGGSAVPLLDAIAAMQRLEELQLSNIRCDWPPPSSAAYSSLTASSNLTRLWLEGCRLPAAASERMFPPAGTLYEFIMFDDDNVSIIVPWQWADVDRLVMHCPALRSVGLGLESSDDLALLTRLSALTRLDARFAGEPIDEGVFVPGAPGDIVIETAAKFTGLRQLQLSVAGPVDMSAVLPLTALQQLTQLEVQAWPSSTVDDTDDWEDFELVVSGQEVLTSVAGSTLEQTLL